MYNHSGRFVNNNQMGIFVKNFQGKGFRNGNSGGGIGDNNSESFAPFEFFPGFCRMSVYRKQTDFL